MLGGCGLPSSLPGLPGQRQVRFLAGNSTEQEAAGIRMIRIRQRHGDLQIQPTDGSRIEIKSAIQVPISGSAYEGAKKNPQVSRSGDTLEVTADSSAPEGVLNNLVLGVPGKMDLDIVSERGEIRVEAIDGAITVKGGTGPITIADCSGALSVFHRDGKVSISNHDGRNTETRLELDRGEIWYLGKAAGFQARQGSGTLDAGFIRLPASSQITTADADATITVPVDAGVRLDAESGIGQVDPYALGLSDLPRPRGRHPPMRHFVRTLGKGDATITVSAQKGRVVLIQAVRDPEGE
jgi:hypothetical protein